MGKREDPKKEIILEVNPENVPVVEVFLDELADKINSFETEEELRAYLEAEIAKPAGNDAVEKARIGFLKKLSKTTM